MLGIQSALLEELEDTKIGTLTDTSAFTPMKHEPPLPQHRYEAKQELVPHLDSAKYGEFQKERRKESTI
jgi:hypothetical protein